MAIEIERKFRVAGDGWRAGVTERRRIEQAYLSRNDRISLRVRIVDRAKATLTVKSASAGISRHEFEYQIPVADAVQLMELREGAIVAKTRHLLPLDGVTWEIDVFEGDNSGLVVAEVELSSADQRLSLPDWLGEEVSSERRYYNAELSRHPYRAW